MIPASHHSYIRLRTAAGLLLAALFTLSLPSCGRPTTLYAARAQLSDRERTMVAELTHTSPSDAALLRDYLASRAAPEFADAVRAGRLSRGLPARELLRSWGEPDEASRPWLYNFEAWTYNLNGDSDYPITVTFTPQGEVSDFGGNLNSWSDGSDNKKPIDRRTNSSFLIAPNATPLTPRPQTQ